MIEDELAERRKQKQIMADVDAVIKDAKNAVPVDPENIDWSEKKIIARKDTFAYNRIPHFRRP